ncbi:hypothetical protein [Conexibacter woesei]|uniref:Uncharacterized protein n=1 Tax=Conexibacter woesei (strain DSM 14684 / CCUG 47730 / CIP 108061 / JCM 11494 / NBRC 100937 / ID131577) TaxID=469383 RepID=D3F1L5_CONWI|nr:hypothetical protein [Conexibacter woesei]ADB52178.1 hypothetical protein Cwoe_3761 [Conexibacter woesei DSM 14684]
MAISHSAYEHEIELLPELAAAYARRAQRLGVDPESEGEIREALRRRRDVQAELRAESIDEPLFLRDADDPLNQRGLARLIDDGAGSWVDHVDVELATRDEMP